MKVRGLNAFKLLFACCAMVFVLGCCTGCDNTAAMMQKLPDDYSTTSIADDIKSAIGEGTKITSQLADLSQSQNDLLRMHEETIARLTDQSVTNRDRIETLTKYVSTLDEKVKMTAVAESADVDLTDKVASLQAQVGALEAKVQELDARCQCGNQQVKAAPVKSAVSGYGSTGSAPVVSYGSTGSAPMTVQIPAESRQVKIVEPREPRRVTYAEVEPQTQVCTGPECQAAQQAAMRSRPFSRLFGR